MLGLFAMMLQGIGSIGKSIQDSRDERQSKEIARQSGSTTYYDSDGMQRDLETNQEVFIRRFNNNKYDRYVRNYLPEIEEGDSYSVTPKGRPIRNESEKYKPIGYKPERYIKAKDDEVRKYFPTMEKPVAGCWVIDRYTNQLLIKNNKRLGSVGFEIIDEWELYVDIFYDPFKMEYCKAIVRHDLVSERCRCYLWEHERILNHFIKELGSENIEVSAQY